MTPLMGLVLAIMQVTVQVAAKGSNVSGILQKLLEGLAQGEQAFAALERLHNQIVEMQHAGREPTEDEWVALTLRSDKAHEILSTITEKPLEHVVKPDPGAAE